MEIVIIYMKQKIVQIIGGSASTAFALEDSKSAWPDLIRVKYPTIEFRYINQPLMTLVKSLSHIENIDHSEVLILHFGTSVGWPEPVIKLGHTLGMELHNEHSFHQPPKKYSGSPFWRMKKVVRLKIRNLFKYALFALGLYRPRASLREMGDQVAVVASIARKKASKVLWIQHQSLQTNRIVLERSLYRRYYREIIDALSPMVSESFKVLQLPKNFLRSDNYLLDGVHLTEDGHRELAKLIEEKLAAFLHD
jgi:hypothetical protein